MFCIASRYQTSPQNLDQVAKIFQEQALPLVSNQQGFKLNASCQDVWTVDILAMFFLNTLI